MSAGRLSGAARITVRSNPGPPMTLANMRLNGVRMVKASCANCGREADVNVDLLPETLTVPEAGQRLRCGPTRANTRPRRGGSTTEVSARVKRIGSHPR